MVKENCIFLYFQLNNCYTGATTQKLIALLKSDVQAYTDNALMGLTNAVIQGRMI